jgi:hypothetical protein
VGAAVPPVLGGSVGALCPALVNIGQVLAAVLDKDLLDVVTIVFSSRAD